MSSFRLKTDFEKILQNKYSDCKIVSDLTNGFVYVLRLIDTQNKKSKKYSIVQQIAIDSLQIDLLTYIKIKYYSQTSINMGIDPNNFNDDDFDVQN